MTAQTKTAAATVTKIAAVAEPAPVNKDALLDFIAKNIPAVRGLTFTRGGLSLKVQRADGVSYVGVVEQIRKAFPSVSLKGVSMRNPEVLAITLTL